MTDELHQCPVCNQRTLTDHCTSPTCPWHRCRNRDCWVTLDLGEDRGFGGPDNNFEPFKLSDLTGGPS